MCERRQATHLKLINADGGAKMLHQVTKPTPRRTGASVFAVLEEDAVEEARIRVKFKEWHDLLQFGPEVQNQDRA